ncbi:alkaline phosphatase-like protein [Actinomycetes bacterium]|nr:alkaline phosphatase-like protein [Actinomycetes bacterium]
MLGDLANWVQDVINQFGYFGVALLVVIENVFPPIPSEIVLPFAGFVAQQGSAGVAQSDTSVIGMMIAATIGSVVGALILYVISSAIGPERLRAFVQRFGRWFGVKQTDLLRAEAWFDRRSFVAVLVGRCVPLIRSIVSIPAGFRRMKLMSFILLTAVGSAVWNIALIGAGAILGDQWERVGEYVGVFQWLVVGAILVLLVRFVYSKLQVRRRQNGATN